MLKLSSYESVLDHEALPEWDTATAFDLCLTCAWPVEKQSDGRWHHEQTNPDASWTDRRFTGQTCRSCDKPIQPGVQGVPWVHGPWPTRMKYDHGAAPRGVGRT